MQAVKVDELISASLSVTIKIHSSILRRCLATGMSSVRKITFATAVYFKTQPALYLCSVKISGTIF